jgi:hypothetical protein
MADSFALLAVRETQFIPEFGTAILQKVFHIQKIDITLRIKNTK